MTDTELTYSPNTPSPLLDVLSDQNHVSVQINCPVCQSTWLLNLTNDGNIAIQSTDEKEKLDFLAVTEACTLLSDSLVELKKELDKACDYKRVQKQQAWPLRIHIFIPILAGIGTILVGINPVNWSYIGLGLGLLCVGIVLIAFAQFSYQHKCQEQIVLQDRIDTLSTRILKLQYDLNHLEKQRRILIRDI